MSINLMNRSGFEFLLEIYHSIKENKVRTILSGFGISWGILILVVLLGTGKGFQDAIMSMFSVFAQKSIYVYGGSTSMKYNNIKEGRRIRFDEACLDAIKNRYPQVEALSPEVSSSQSIKHKVKSGVFRTIGVDDGYLQIRILKVKDNGRLFNRADMEKKRNVAIIGENVATVLFGNEEVVNKFIQIAGIFYRVIGILKNDDIFGAHEINSVYVPYSSYKETINRLSEFDVFCLYLSQETDSKQFEESLRRFIAHRSHFSSKDKQAVFIANYETQTTAFETLFKGIRTFIWIVGICFLISGIAGISNIMFVTVKERTNEIGIRLAVGAMPKSIVRLVLSESVVITTLAGLAGLVAGKGILMFIDWLISLSDNDLLIKQTSFDYRTTFSALFILIIAGVIAGAFPAIKASNIEPVDAIRYENRG
jgi:putative ABC transport system permease protein